MHHNFRKILPMGTRGCVLKVVGSTNESLPTDPFCFFPNEIHVRSAVINKVHQPLRSKIRFRNFTAPARISLHPMPPKAMPDWTCGWEAVVNRSLVNCYTISTKPVCAVMNSPCGQPIIPFSVGACLLTQYRGIRVSAEDAIEDEAK